MTDRLPDPLTPLDCDVRSYPDMMVDVAALMKSDFSAHPNAEVFRCGVFAWCAAFHEVPAASLPDDNFAIARLIGMGRDPQAGERFAALREQGALHGFIKCSDGRLYHPIIADKVFKALSSKAKNKTRTQAATEARIAAAAERRANRDDDRDGQRSDDRDVKRDGAQNAHQPNLTEPNQTEGKGSKKEKGAELSLGPVVPKKPALKIPDWVPTPAWEGFEEMRKKIRHALTDRAIQLIVKKLAMLKTMGHEPGDVLDQSTRNSWRDVYAIKPEGHSNGAKPARSSHGQGINEAVRRRSEQRSVSAGDRIPRHLADSGSAESDLGKNLLPAPDDNAGGV